HVRKHYRLLIGERRAEEIKIALGSAHPVPGEHRTIEVKGRDLVDGVPKTIVVTDEEVREALREPVMTIVETVRTCLERTPPELAADIVETGVMLTGGDRKSTRLNSSHLGISYAVFCLKKKKKKKKKKNAQDNKTQSYKISQK